MQTRHFQELDGGLEVTQWRWNGRPEDVWEDRLGESRVEKRSTRRSRWVGAVVLGQGEVVIGKAQYLVWKGVAAAAAGVLADCRGRAAAREWENRAGQGGRRLGQAKQSKQVWQVGRQARQ